VKTLMKTASYLFIILDVLIAGLSASLVLLAIGLTSTLVLKTSSTTRDS